MPRSETVKTSRIKNALIMGVGLAGYAAVLVTAWKMREFPPWISAIGLLFLVIAIIGSIGWQLAVGKAGHGIVSIPRARHPLAYFAFLGLEGLAGAAVFAAAVWMGLGGTI